MRRGFSLCVGKRRMNDVRSIGQRGGCYSKGSGCRSVLRQIDRAVSIEIDSYGASLVDSDVEAWCVVARALVGARSARVARYLEVDQHDRSGRVERNGRVVHHRMQLEGICSCAGVEAASFNEQTIVPRPRECEHIHIGTGAGKVVLEYRIQEWIDESPAGAARAAAILCVEVDPFTARDVELIQVSLVRR